MQSLTCETRGIPVTMQAVLSLGYPWLYICKRLRDALSTKLSMNAWASRLHMGTLDAKLKVLKWSLGGGLGKMVAPFTAECLGMIPFFKIHR